MNRLGTLLDRGENHFGSGSSNSEAFLDFYVDFRIKFSSQLKRLNAVEITYSKGHFGLSGFFKVGEQYYYFSVGDVRWNGNRMLIRTAKHLQDYTGGSNNYVTIDESTYKQIAKLFKLDVKAPKTKVFPTIESIAKKIIARGGGGVHYVSSNKKANSIAWKVAGLLGIKSDEGNSIAITTWKRGNRIMRSEVEQSNFRYCYDAESKAMVINFND